MSKAEEARARREANHSDAPADQPAPHPEQAPDAPELDQPPTVSLGPLGQFFRREAEFYRQEAQSMAVMLERLASGKG